MLKFPKGLQSNFSQILQFWDLSKSCTFTSVTHTLEHFEHLRIGCRYWNFNRLVHVRMTLDLTREGYPFRKIGPRRKLSPLTFRAVTYSAVWKGWRPACQKVAKSWLWLACQQKDMDSTGTRVAIFGDDRRAPPPEGARMGLTESSHRLIDPFFLGLVSISLHQSHQILGMGKNPCAQWTSQTVTEYNKIDSNMMVAFPYYKIWSMCGLVGGWKYVPLNFHFVGTGGFPISLRD